MCVFTYILWSLHYSGLCGHQRRRVTRELVELGGQSRAIATGESLTGLLCS